jgi:hypothetical protein
VVYSKGAGLAPRTKLGLERQPRAPATVEREAVSAGGPCLSAGWSVRSVACLRGQRDVFGIAALVTRDSGLRRHDAPPDVGSGPSSSIILARTLNTGQRSWLILVFGRRATRCRRPANVRGTLESVELSGKDAWLYGLFAQPGGSLHGLATHATRTLRHGGNHRWQPTRKCAPLQTRTQPSQG